MKQTKPDWTHKLLIRGFIGITSLAVLSHCFDMHLAAATKNYAVGTVCRDGDFHIYTATRYMGDFDRTGLAIGPVDRYLVPHESSGIWGNIGRVGGGMFSEQAHGAAWNGLTIPLWKFVFAFGVYPIVYLIQLTSKTPGIKARRTARGLCATCGYDLRATPDRCPECGTPKNTAIHSR